MAKNILEGLPADLAGQVERATDAEKRAICLAICKGVTAITRLDEPVIGQALRSLVDGSYGDPVLAASVEHLVEQLDDRYFAAQRRYHEGKEDEVVYRDLFRKARAANAVLFALNHDPFVAATHSVYETYAALGESETQSLINDGISGKN